MNRPREAPFGDVLRRYRNGVRLTQKALAHKARISVQSISALERGINRAPHRDTILALASALELSARDRSLLESAARRPSSQAAVSTMLTPTVPLAPFVGRCHELAKIDRALMADGPVMLAVAGEPGIGKSRLLAEAAERAIPLGWVVLGGGCTRRRGQEPFAPLLGALASYPRRCAPGERRAGLAGCAWLAHLLPELAESMPTPMPAEELPPAQERRLIALAVRRFLANIAGPAGTLLLLDDLQWATEDALDLLAAVIAIPATSSLRVLGAYRDTEVLPQHPLAHLLADLAREGWLTHLPLGPLAAAEADALARCLLRNAEVGSQDALDGLAARIVRRAEGVPFFLVSCALALRSGTLATEMADLAREVPWDARASIRQRIAMLPAAGWELLGIAAVAGRYVERAVMLSVAEMLGLCLRETLAALQAAAHARLLAEEETTSYRFSHDLIREVVLLDLGAAGRAVLHLRLAEALERRPARERRAAELAWHFVEADEARRALPYAIQAGDQAAALHALSEAERHYRSALELARAVGDLACEAEVLERQRGLQAIMACSVEARVET